MSCELDMQIYFHYYTCSRQGCQFSKEVTVPKEENASENTLESSESITNPDNTTQNTSNTNPSIENTASDTLNFDTNNSNSSMATSQAKGRECYY